MQQKNEFWAFGHNLVGDSFTTVDLQSRPNFTFYSGDYIFWDIEFKVNL